MRLSIGGLLILAACSTPVAVIDQLQIDAFISSTTVSPANPVTIAVKMTNVGTRTINASGDACPPKFDIVSEAGEIVGPHRSTLICNAGSVLIRLDPGESHTIEYKWDGGGESGLLPAGNYAIRGNYAGKLSEETPITLEN